MPTGRYGFAETGRGKPASLGRRRSRPEADHQHTGTAYLYVEDADALYDEWARPGVGGRTRRVGDTPYKLREGSHVDPDGNLIRFGSPMPGRPGERLRAHLETRYEITVDAMTELDLGVWRVGRAEGPDWVARWFPARRAAEAVAGDAAILGYLAAHEFPAERCAADEPVSVLDGRSLLVTEWAGPVPRQQRRDAIRAAGGLSHLGALLDACTRWTPRRRQARAASAMATGRSRGRAVPGITSPTGRRRRRSRPRAGCSPRLRPSFPTPSVRRSTRSGRRSPRWTRRRDCPRGSSTGFRPVKIVEGRVRVAASDVANFLACQELTQLDLRAARRTLRPPHPVDLGFEDLVRRGEEHERAVLEGFRADGCEVADLSGAGDPAGATAAAIRGGAGVIYQGTLAGAGLFGRPDFLVRADLLAAPDGEPRPGGRHYEVVDAKLARTAKARAVLQTAFYSRLLAELQGTEPRWMHLALGNGEFVPFKVRDFAAYERQTRRRLEEVLAAGPPAGLYPEPVEHCAICRWSDLCAGAPAGRRRPVPGRRDDDGAAAGAEGGRDRHPARVRGPGRTPPAGAGEPGCP